MDSQKILPRLEFFGISRNPCILYCYLYPLCILYRLYDFMQMKKLSDEFSARLNKLSDKLRSPL